MQPTPRGESIVASRFGALISSTFLAMLAVLLAPSGDSATATEEVRDSGRPGSAQEPDNALDYTKYGNVRIGRQARCAREFAPPSLPTTREEVKALGTVYILFYCPVMAQTRDYVTSWEQGRPA
jgi:hypothetical protein